MRSHSCIPALAFVASLSIPGCAAQQSQASGPSRAQDAVRVQIEQGTARFAEAFNRGDITAVAAMYDTGAVVLAPNAPVMRGRQNIEALWNGARQQGFRTLNLTVNSVESIGNHAIELGSYTLVIQPPGLAEVTDRGKYMVLWRRQADGSWKLYRDMFNTSMPAR
jgi:ketosteroid isomerase-like protein